MQELWTAVDDYFSDALLPPDPILDAVLAASQAADLPEIHVSAHQGKLLNFFAQMQGARTILEIGTLAAYSTIWLARAIPDDGHVITLEFDPKHAEIAQKNIELAGVADKVTIRQGVALDTLPTLVDNRHAPFDMVFIDADKPNNSNYFNWALQLTHVGSLIIVDNVVRNGSVLDADSDDERVHGVRDFIEMLKTETRVSVATMQTVGSKGYDGLLLARVIA